MQQHLLWLQFDCFSFAFHSKSSSQISTTIIRLRKTQLRPTSNCSIAPALLLQFAIPQYFPFPIFHLQILSTAQSMAAKCRPPAAIHRRTRTYNSITWSVSENQQAFAKKIGCRTFISQDWVLRWLFFQLYVQHVSIMADRVRSLGDDDIVDVDDDVADDDNGDAEAAAADEKLICNNSIVEFQEFAILIWWNLYNCLSIDIANTFVACSMHNANLCLHVCTAQQFVARMHAYTSAVWRHPRGNIFITSQHSAALRQRNTQSAFMDAWKAHT